MTEPIYTKADLDAARAMALGEAALTCFRQIIGTAVLEHRAHDAGVDACYKAIRALSTDAAAIFAERDRDMKAQGYREALEDVKDMAQRYGAIVAEDIESIANPYEGKR